MGYANQYGDELDKLKNQEENFRDSAIEVMKVIENQPNTIKGLAEQINKIKEAQNALKEN